MEMDLGVGCFGHAGQATNGRLGAHHLIIRTLMQLDLPGWSLAWTDGEPLVLTSNVMRNPCSVNCHASHACEAGLALCSWPLCRESGFAMRLRLPGPWPGNVFPEAVFATPMRLRNSSSPTQCVFAMRLRHPMRLHNASAPPNASSQCVCACQCVFTQCVFRMRLRPLMRLRLLGLFVDECVFAMRMRLQVVYHTPPRRRNLYIYIYVHL